MQKGSLADLILIPVLLFGIGVGFLVTLNVNTRMAQELQNTTIVQQNTYANASISNSLQATRAGDEWLVLGLLGLLIGADVLVLSINSHPVYLFAGILFLIIGSMLAYHIYVNATPALYQAGVFENAPLSYTLFQVFPYVYLANGIIFLMMFYAKTPEMV